MGSARAGPMVGIGWAFSNFRKETEPLIDVYAIEYATIEHFYQAHKSALPEERGRVAALPTPGEAKRFGRRLTLREGWEGMKLGVMAEALRQVYRRESARGARLLEATPEELVEWNSWHDLYWGKCVCSKHEGDGHNWLGVLLRVRQAVLRWDGR